MKLEGVNSGLRIHCEGMVENIIKIYYIHCVGIHEILKDLIKILHLKKFLLQEKSSSALLTILLHRSEHTQKKVSW